MDSMLSVPDHSLASSLYFRELIERNDIEEMTIAPFDLNNGLTGTERLALMQRNALRVNQELAVAIQERGRLREENANLAEQLAERNLQVEDLQEDVYVPMRISIMSRINAVKQKVFLSNVVGSNRGNGIVSGSLQVAKFYGKLAFIVVSPAAGVTTFLSCEASNIALKTKASLELDKIKRDVSEKPLLMRNLEFKEDYETSVAALDRELATHYSLENIPEHNVNVERIIRA